MRDPEQHPNARWVAVAGVFASAALYALIWWVLTAGAADAWLIGVPVVIAATAMGHGLLPVVPGSVRGLLRFVPFFLWHSLRGGIDVARRALRPGDRLRPDVLDHQLRVRGEVARAAVIDVLGLLPGTLCVDCVGDRLIVHVLDAGLTGPEALRLTEERVAALLGQRLDAEAVPHVPDAAS